MTQQEYRRLLRLPMMIENARRKLAMLEAEAKRHRLYELIQSEHQA